MNMSFFSNAFILLLVFVIGANTDSLGPIYPVPRDLSSRDSLVRAGWDNLTSMFEQYLKGNHDAAAAAPLSGIENVTFSLGLFSIHDPAAAELQYHYASPEVVKAPNGTHKVDGDSIYRIASVSKLFTVYAGMIELSSEDWNRPITDFIPELSSSTGKSDDDNVPALSIGWDAITLWALAAQLAGVPQIGWPVSDLLFTSTVEAAADEKAAAAAPSVVYGFPPLDLNILGPCSNASQPLCPTNDFSASLRSQPPSFLPWTSPAYADSGFMLLGLAIANITNKPIEVVYHDSIFEPLGMTSSNSTVPTGEAALARSVLADPQGFSIAGGFTIPSGGLFSTINDLAKFGTSLLNSTLLSTNVTRKWMKPITHTASLTHSVGAPWEIQRYIHPSTGKVTDLYTKLGDSGSYGGVTVVIPDYGAGFSMLNGHSNGTVRSLAANTILDYVTEAVLSALEAQAAAEATRNFVGTYVSTDSKLNSSLTIAFNESTVKAAPLDALSVSAWISNGTDVLASDLFEGVKPRLLPTILNPHRSNGAGQVAFQASTNPQTNSYTQAGELPIGPFTGQYATNFDWLIVDQRHYGGIAIDLFVFDVDDKGKAIAVRPAVTRSKLKRSN